MNDTKLSVVIPLYNEHDNIADFYRKLTELMREYGETYELIFVDDGSEDDTSDMVRIICEHDKRSRLITLSKNFGYNAAASAGISESIGDAVMLTNTSSKAPTSAVISMLDRWEEGYELVTGCRLNTRQEVTPSAPAAKRPLLSFVDRIDSSDNGISDGSIIVLDRKVVNAMEAFPERNRYSVPQLARVGFRQTVVEYINDDDSASGTELNRESVKKQLWLKAGGAAKFSRKTLLIPAAAGALISVISLVSVIMHLISYRDTGWLPLAVAVLFLLNGLLFITVGVVGEIVVRLSDEARGRPLYIVSDRIGFDN